MTIDQKKDVAKLITLTAKFFDKDLSPDVALLAAEDLSDLDYHKVKMSLVEYRKNPKNNGWPRPAVIRAIINPTQSKEAIANEAASRIRYAITKFGWCNGKEAQAHIGELGWAIVQRSGGWDYVCQQHGVELNPLTFHAQARDLAKSILESAELGLHDQPIAIPDSNKSTLENVTKLLTIKEVPK